MIRFTLPMIAVALAVAIACNETPVEPTPEPTPQTVSENFSGTLTPNSARTHTFTTPSSGSVTATLTEFGPDESLKVGLSLGTWNGSACQTVIANDLAVKGTTLRGSAGSAGTLCVRIYDVATLSETATYTLLVVHP